MTDFSRTSAQNQDEPLHPAIAEMDEDQITVLAGMARGIVPEGESSPFDEMVDRDIASALLNLQDHGLITLGVTEDYENYSITLNNDPEKAKWEREQRLALKDKPKNPRRRYKRRSW